MRTTNSQDQSTQAMTEVALALSMAFFSLLLLALVSIGVPQPIDNTEQEMHTTVPAFVLTESTQTKQSTEGKKQPTKIQYVFYYAANLYDQNLMQTQISKLNTMQKLVLAMPMDTDVIQALSLQKKFKDFDLSLTIMDNEWLAAFESKM
ncbi:hypothetical protein [Brumicola pallidula]|jgi:hypothetical protein|uniref:Uncharacterized protein n=1 Tax=Brumicola pallidula DSM 14239 = ACAM 615 TaxID=1121922 RepID=K6ZKF3_9ALTE|nr:hypothetical protein [Glaciecola pallidula]GAC29368.1 hypothetical protein GPAL_2511 [Glaciecola pallidula DSM 14239 = ACAM 615]